MMFAERDNPNGNQSGSNVRSTAVVCHSYSRALIESRLSSRLKIPVRVETSELEFGSFEDFTSRIDSPSSICAYLLGGRHRAAVEINQSLAFSMVDLMMGGKGYPPVETRPLSPLEQSLLGGVFESLATDFGKSWQQLLPFEWSRGQEVQFTYSLDGFNPHEKMVLARFDIGIAELAQGAISMALPVGALRPQQHAARPPDPRDEDIAEYPLASVLPISVEVVLPPTELTVEQLLEINEGDVLEFGDWEVAPDADQSIEVIVCVEGRARLRGKLGVMNAKKTVEITAELAPNELPDLYS
ncbi:MAG: FliM/FliN family flagellar motor switch protein [Candidatus Poribacteria bacterium]|nr:FliM/FliN family flagellar motor switch protein [Candidatus Poribacteria bacterium]